MGQNIVMNLMDKCRQRKNTQIPGFGMWSGGSVVHLHRVTKKTMLREDVEFDFFFGGWYMLSPLCPWDIK